MDLLVLLVFGAVYLGMILGELPGLAIDRTGVALLGAIALLLAGRLTTEEAARAIDFPTIGLLLGLMVVSAQFRLSGFYSAVVRRVAGAGGPPQLFLALVILAAGVLSALLANDIVCLAMTPVLIECCAQRALHPKPFLLALACAANVGSAATLIGNPQNMLIGQVLQLSFAGYLQQALMPTLLGLLVTWGVVAWYGRGKWRGGLQEITAAAPPLDRWQTAKGVAVTLAIVGLFLASSWPREIIALGGAGVLLCSRKLHSRHMLGLVDWQLLLLFAGLFAVNHVMRSSGNLAVLMAHLRSTGVRLEEPAWLFGTTAVLSNVVSNVPAVMLLLPYADHPLAGAILALASTLAGNLFIVGSIANMIVIDQAQRLGVRISWRDHARVGVPVTLLTLGIAAAWLL